MVGDSLTSDMKGGEDYGIDTCWYNPSLKENGTDVNPTYEVESLLQILEIVEVAEEKGSFILIMLIFVEKIDILKKIVDIL